MAGQYPDDNDDERSPVAEPWYNRTPNVIGASVAGLGVVGILIAAVTFVSGQFNQPTEAPLNYVEPTFSATATGSSSATTTTATITSTSPPVTTDINGPSSTTSPSEVWSSDRSTQVTQSRPSNDGSAPSTTRRGPRTNVTRTLYPQP
jgi:cytoskeletal protein RodZ